MIPRMALLLTLIINPAISQDKHNEAPDRQASDLAAIVALEHRDAEAAKVNDVETLVSLWTEDGVLLQPRSKPVVGIKAIRQLLEQEKQQSANVTTLTYDENWEERRITPMPMNGEK